MPAYAAARSVEEGGEVCGLVLAAGPALVGVVEVGRPGVEGAGLLVVLLHLELPAAASVVTQLGRHLSTLCNKQINNNF